MPDLALGTGDTQGVCMLTENGPDGVGLGNITQRSTGAMSVDVVHVIRRDASVGNRKLNRSRCAGAPRVR